jgi:hypothetical protein
MPDLPRSRPCTSQRHVFTVCLHCPARFQPHGSSKSHRPANIHTKVGLYLAPAATYTGQRSRQLTCTSVSFNAFRQRGSSLSRHAIEGPAGAAAMITADDKVGIIPARQQWMMPMVEMPGRKLSVSLPGMCVGQPATWKASAHILAAPVRGATNLRTVTDSNHPATLPRLPSRLPGIII